MDFLNYIEATSSSSTLRWEYDVFLSFRGEDTREGFTGYLYKALCDKGIHTFIDDKLQKGEEISEELIQAIKNSSILVVVFSENYAESKWCLDELAEIVECREKDQEVQIRPVFYNVDPSEIRNQKGNFGKALAEHEKKLKDNKNKVQKWRDALRKAANTSGWHYKKGYTTYKSESHFIQNIVEEISNARLNWMPLQVAKCPVGINSRAETVVSLLDIGLDEFCVVGIHGLPGVGKTTIAKAVYNKIAKHFDGSSFLMNVRESLGTDAGIITLQKQLLNDILGEENWRVGNKFKGISLIEKRLGRKKVFLILDDVDDSTRIENLLGKCNWFTPGSRAIITLRDRHLLTTLKENVCTTYKVKEFEVEQLNQHEALQLFKEHAFPGNKPHDEDYSKLATKFIDFANGLPLALEIIARDLCGRAKDEWESALDMYKKIPNKGIQNILQVSYEGLQDTEKDIFLDIACFFKGWDKNYVVKILNACELYPRSGIPRLVNKCLITIDKSGSLSMHDLIQQMGKEVVRRQAPDILKNRSRLCCYKDSLKVLTTDKGSDKIRGIILDSPQVEEVQLNPEAFRRMENLKFLIVENVHICKPVEFLPNSLILLKWPRYPFDWPSEYFPEKLVAIEMPWSRISLQKLIKEECRLENLKDVNLRGCKLITNLNLSWAPNLENLDLYYCVNLEKLSELWAPKLENLNLAACRNLVEIDGCFGSLENLKTWNLRSCMKLQFLPSQLRLKSLYSLHLTSCISLRDLPSSIEHLTKLDTLDLYECHRLQNLPDSIYKLQRLREFRTSTAKLRPTCTFDSSSGYGFVKMKALNFEGNKTITELDLLMKPEYFPTLEMINLTATNIVTIPESISRFPRLKTLFVRGCMLLREIQGLPQSIRIIFAENCKLLDTQSPSGLLNQVIEIIGILPSRVCGRARSHKLMDPQLTNYFPSETEGAESKDEDISMDPLFSNRTIHVWGIEIPKWFNHQSVDNSIFFYVGRKFPKLALCFVPGQEGLCGFVHISINGCKKSDEHIHEIGNHLCLFSPPQWSLQRHLNESNPTDQNLVEVSITYTTYFGGSIKRWGVHAECICPPQDSANAPIWYSKKRLGVQVDDIADNLPTLKKLKTF